MFYKQIILQRGLPFDVKLPKYELPDVSSMTTQQLHNELEKGYNEAINGCTVSAQAAFDEPRKEYGI